MSNPQSWPVKPSIVVGFLCLLALAGCSKGTVSGYLDAAQSDYKAGKINAAIIDVKNALQLEPKNQQARLLLAHYYLQLPDPTSAQGELLRAKQDGAPVELIAPSLAEADLLLGRAPDALKDTDLPNAASPEPKATLLGLRGQALVALGKMTDTHQALDSGLKENHRSLPVLEGWIQYALATNDVGAARNYLADAQKEDPNSARLFSLAGAIGFAANDYGAAESAYRSMLAVAPWSLTARIGLARAETAENKQDEADKTITAVLKDVPNNPIANYIGAVVEYRKGNYPEARTRVQRALASAKNFAPALLIGGATAYALKDYEQANTYLNQFIFLQPDNVQARKLLAATQVALGHSSDAVSTLLTAVKSNPEDTQLLAMVGEASARSGNLSAAGQYGELIT